MHSRACAAARLYAASSKMRPLRDRRGWWATSAGKSARAVQLCYNLNFHANVYNSYSIAICNMFFVVLFVVCCVLTGLVTVCIIPVLSKSLVLTIWYVLMEIVSGQYSKSVTEFLTKYYTDLLWNFPKLDICAKNSVKFDTSPVKLVPSNCSPVIQNVHCVSKKRPTFRTCYNFYIHSWTATIFGTNVAEKVGNQNVLYFPTTSN